jgi:hypothetical protein
MFDLASSLEATNRGGLDDWVDRYLIAGPWANAGLRKGLRRQSRYWLGPLFVARDRLERCCGPEPSMEYWVAAKVWNRRMTSISLGLRESDDVPPLIVEFRSGTLSIRDGNHRAAAMLKAGWTHCWIIIWCNSLADYDAARAVIDMTSSPTTSGIPVQPTTP